MNPSRLRMPLALLTVLALCACADPGPDQPAASSLDTVAVVPGPAPDTLAVPAAAIVEAGDRTAVYVVDYQGTVGLRYVDTGVELPGDRVTVGLPLHQGEQVAINPPAAEALYRRQQASAHPTR